MRLHILGQGFELTKAIEGYVHRRFNLALGTASGHINGMCVRLADINSDRGGIDKRCRVVIWLRSMRTVMVEAVEGDMYAAIDEAAARAKAAIWRNLKRRRTLKREYADRQRQRMLVG